MPKIDVAVVEDDGSVRKPTGHLLRLLGYTTAAFVAAEDFLEAGRAGDAA